MDKILAVNFALVGLIIYVTVCTSGLFHRFSTVCSQTNFLSCAQGLLSHPSERDISTAMPFTMPARRTFSTKVELAVALAQFVSEQSSASIGDHGYFAVAFSGGSLPSILAEGLQSIQIDVTKWKVFFADERCVPLDNPESNFKAVQEQCLSKIQVPPSNVFTIDEGLIGNSTAAANAYEATLKRELGDQPRLDLVLLGMGPDGHTCSLFPGHKLLDEKTMLVAGIDDSPKPPPSRITLTYPALEAASNVAFVCTGAGKADAIQQIFQPSREEDTLPAGNVHARIGVVWFLDDSAAANLES